MSHPLFDGNESLGDYLTAKVRQKLAAYRKAESARIEHEFIHGKPGGLKPRGILRA